MMGATDRSPFTPNQWQELEHQALIYKYMVSGVSIPPELIFSIRRSLDSSLGSRFIPHQPVGLGCFQVGFGRKVDPEPGRCRRTDGKKWRCSKEAYPDSRYCEKHMRRGRNRSRKPVESPTTAFTAALSTSKPSISTNSSLPSSPISSSVSVASHDTYYRTTPHRNNPKFNSPYFSHSLYPYSSSSSSSKPLDSGLSLQNSSAHLNALDTGSCSQATKDFRYLQGIRESTDERTYFPGASGNSDVRSLQDSSYQPFTVSSSYNKAYSSQQQCFVMGTDMFKSTRTKTERKEEDEEEQHESKKPLHHFFGDDWPQTKNTADSWLDLASNSRPHTSS